MRERFESKTLASINTLSFGTGFSPGRLLRVLLWILIPIVLWWVLKDISLTHIIQSLARLKFTTITGLILLNGIIVTFFSSRWWVILRTLGYPRSYLRLILYRLVAFSISYFTPGSQFGGEPFQVFLLNKQEKVPSASAVASVTIDKLFELLANFTFLLIGVMTIILTGSSGNKPTSMLLLIPTGLLTIPLGYLIALRLGLRPFSTLFSVLSGRFVSHTRLRLIAQALDSAEKATASFYREKPAAIAVSVSLSIVIWILIVVEFHLALRWLGASPTLPQTVFALTAARLAFLLPLPGGLGTLEASQVLVMERLGIDPAIGVSLSLLIRARDVILAGCGLLVGSLLSREVLELKSRLTD